MYTINLKFMIRKVYNIHVCTQKIIMRSRWKNSNLEMSAHMLEFNFFFLRMLEFHAVILYS